MKSLTYIEIDVPDFAGSVPEVLTTVRFALPASYLPPEIDAIPSIGSISFTPATISLGENLGQRASLKIAFNDHRHIFNGEPYSQGTFWGKWRGRYGTKLRGRQLRLIRGFLGQTIAQMDTRHYIIETTDGPTPDAVYSIEAKDVLKFADDDRSQAPQLSDGNLAGSINATTTAAVLSPAGIGNIEYPASGWVCLGGKEICSFTRAGDALAITRGELGSVAIAHDAGDRVQLVLRYPGNDVADIIYDLLTTYAGIPAGYITLADWKAETSANLAVIYAATITEPTSVKKLVSELIQQASLALWWDDQAEQIRLQVLREIATDVDIFDQDRIIEGSLNVSEQPTKRISEIWAYYGQRDPTDNADKQDNYRAALASVDLARETEYGSAEISKLQCRWIQTLTAAERLTQIQLSRFRDPPRAFSFDLFHDEIVSLGGGYQVKWWANQDRTGIEVPAKIQVTKITAYPDRLHIEAEEMLASGTVVLTNTIILTDAGALRDFVVPATWNSANNSVSLLGAGGGGDGVQGNGGSGAGGGAFSRKANVALTPGSTVKYQIGAAGLGRTPTLAQTDGGDTWFGAPTFGAAPVAAKGGTKASGGPGQGGQAAAGIGDLKHSGGDGGSGAPSGESRAGGGGGGGAAGPNGDGAHGGNLTASNQDAGSGGGGADGGQPGAVSVNQTAGDGGNNRFNFGGGTSSIPTGKEGGGGRGGDSFDLPGGDGGTGEQLWTQTIAPITSAGPGGGAGGGGSGKPGYRGGKYGGGGGGGGQFGNGGDGYQGCIVITWKEAA